MRNLILLSALFLSTNVFGQKGYYKIPTKFYSIIDSTKKLQCCDSSFHTLAITYDIPLYELPLDKLDIEEYENQVMQDSYIESYVHELVEAYHDLNPKIRSKITKSCFKLKTEYKITKDVTADGYYWVEGTLKVAICFQSNDKYWGYPWWKKFLGIKLKA